MTCRHCPSPATSIVTLKAVRPIRDEEGRLLRMEPDTTTREVCDSCAGRWRQLGKLVATERVREAA